MAHKIYPFLSYIFLLVLCSFCTTLSATHNRAGEITYEQTGNLTITATITTYTRTSSEPADRDSLEICWGDGNCQWLLRVNGTPNSNGVPQGQPLQNDTKRNLYTGEHTYAAQAHYVITMTDPNRNAGICNVNEPNSDTVPFHLRTTVTFFNTQFSGFNSSPILLYPPIDIGCVGQPFVHNPSAYDPDGDSLSYHLIVPFQSLDMEAINYNFPNEPPNNLSLDETTGDLFWGTPHEACEYNIAMIIVEYRNGVAIDTTVRDMQILIAECSNLPPVIEAVEEICVIAGETVEFDVIATAPLSESDQLVNLIAIGSPLEIGPIPATFDQQGDYGPQPLTGKFTWNTSCENIAEQPYTVIFRAADNFPIPVTIDGQTDTSFLSTVKTVRIRVVGPPPEDVFAEAENGEVSISWFKPYDCEEVEDEYFQGFTVWRKVGTNPFIVDSCDPGLEGKGYEKLTLSPIMDVVDDRYFYLDQGVERGLTYCYRILAEFARTSPGGFPFNRVESLPSDEFCVQLPRDVPLIVNVSVEETDPNNGEIFVRWTKPIVADLDTILNGGPYRYELYMAEGYTNNQDDFSPVPGANFISSSFAQANDTMFTVTGLNTLDLPYSFRIAFHVENDSEVFGFSTVASSVYLNIASTDNTNTLTWEENIPWGNFQYTIFRQNGMNVFDSIATTFDPIYVDSELVNGQEYCYEIETYGTYGIEGIREPLRNFSQENCGIPIDTMPPCPPELTVENICDNLLENGSCVSEDLLKNELSWDNPNNRCEETEDVVSYNIYYASTENDPFNRVTSIQQDTFNYDHFPQFGLAGCYAVTAVDSFANESVFSNIVCVDNCPIYELPNTFTPNGDQQNDFFKPYPYCFIDRIEIKIFNRWGQLVYETSDPDINWDGTNLNGEQLAESVYYYSCKVFEQRVAGVTERSDILSGFIQLIRGEN